MSDWFGRRNDFCPAGEGYVRWLFQAGIGGTNLLTTNGSAEYKPEQQY